VLGRGTRRVVNRAATALRQSANTLMRSRTYLGAQYRRLRTKQRRGHAGRRIYVERQAHVKLVILNAGESRPDVGGKGRG
jgi:hypothetical protein